MEKLGVWLRQAREAKGSTLEEVGMATRIRPRFLGALEAGDFAAFPGGEVQVHGFLRIYARYLDLPADTVLARYHAERHGGELAWSSAAAETASTSPSRSSTRPMTYRPRDVSLTPPQSRWMNLESLIVVGVVLIVVLVIVTAVGVVGYLISQNGGAEEDIPPTAISSLVSPESEQLSTAMTPLPLPAITPAFPVSPDGDVTLTLEAGEHVWVRVTRDSQIIFEKLMSGGQAETWSAQQTISVETGNGAGLMVTVNGQPQGPMCGRGQVCTRTWGPVDEIATPYE